MRILVCVPGYLPGHKSGGPIRTIENLISSLSDEHEFFVVCRDRDLGDAFPYAGIDHHGWNRMGAAHVRYVKGGVAGYLQVALLLLRNKFDLIYPNSFFSLQFSFFPIIFSVLFRPRSKILVGPRGEFSPGALVIKARRKRLFLWICNFLGMYRSVVWHASSSHEAVDIHAVIGKSAVVRVAEDLVAPPSEILNRTSDKCFGKVRVVFISRISKKKNLKFALEVISRVRLPIEFDIYGPVEDRGYFAECQRIVANLPANVCAVFKGDLKQREVYACFAQYDLFFFPTLGENFGHVIIESMLAGTPVLVSDQTPWRALETAGVGWDLPLSDMEGFVSVIESVAHYGAEEYKARRAHVSNWAIQFIDKADAVDENRRLFEEESVI